jgi:hypothetical protein
MHEHVITGATIRYSRIIHTSICGVEFLSGGKQLELDLCLKDIKTNPAIMDWYDSYVRCRQCMNLLHIHVLKEAML